MEHIHVGEQETCLDEKAAHNRDDTGFEEDDLSTISESEFDLKIERISHNIPWILDVKQPNNNLRCSQKLCPCGKELAFPDCSGFVCPNNNLVQCCIDSAELQAPNSLIFCRATPIIDVPTNLRSSEFIFDSFKHRRRTHSIKDLGDFIAEYSPAAGTGSIIISPSGRWIFDLIEATFKARGLLKGSLSFQPNTPDVILSEVRLKSVNTRQIKFSELTSSPSRLCLGSPQRPKGILSPFKKQRSDVSISDRMLLSPSSTNLSSYQSSSSAHGPVSTGLLQCVWQSGMRYFVFSVDDDQNEVYVANPLKIESYSDKALDYMYLFHSRTDNRKDSRNRTNSTLEFVGKMKVSSSLILETSRSNFMETEFVLFGDNEKHSRETQNLSSTLTKGKGLSKKVSEMFRPSHSVKNKSAYIVGEQNTQFKDLREVFVGDLSKIDELGPVNHLADDFPTNLQLVSIVVKDYQHDLSKKAAVSGWGLKFLKKAEDNRAETSAEPSFSSQSHEEAGASHRKECRTISVLVPAGLHGGPITRTGGPSSLTERWRSGGHCDCGGWDIGCPLTVFNNHSICSEAQENCNSVNLFVEGSKHGEPMLKLEKVNDGLYLIYFQSRLSALQSFSVAVAIMHTQSPDLYPKL